MSLRILLFTISLVVSVKTIESAVVNIGLKILNTNTYNGPEYIGIGMGHSSLKGNWLIFLQRLGVNGARLFVSSTSDLRTFIGTSEWGKDLNGVNVTNYNQYLTAVADLRTPNGRNITYTWSNPVKWKQIFDKINTISQTIYGTDENTINKIKSININPLVVEHMGCSGASTTIEFQSMDPSTPIYWAERWEIYKHSYAMAVWAKNKDVKMIEFYNEPDLQLGACLDPNKYKEYYMIRSLSIQNAYADINDQDPLNKIDVKVIASAFARITYGDDLTRYLGDVSVQNRNYLFGNPIKNTNWSNMQFYSYHTYGKTGYDMYNDLNTIQTSINADTTYSNEIPAIITEHNAHTSSSWDSLTTTADDSFEASRLASQIMYLVLAKINSHYVFKFSITPSFAANREVAKNGLNWGEIYLSPFHISDTTLCAEAMRLLTKMKQSTIYPTSSNDTSKYRTYLGSLSPIDNIYYLHIVNDKNDSVTLSIDLSAWNIISGAQIIVEVVADGYWGEVSSIIITPNSNGLFNVGLLPFSVTRLSIPNKIQKSVKSFATLTCTARGGALSSQSDCFSASFFSGTSNTMQQENTCVGLIKFPLNPSVPISQRSILKLNVEEVVLTTDITIMVLGYKNSTIYWDQNLASWNMMSNLTSGLNVLNKLDSGIIIDSINKTFINWSSSSNISIVGHISAKGDVKNQIRMIDVTDYVSDVIRSGGSLLTFILFRPFRHPSYNTSVGPIPADDLSKGASMKLSGANSLNKPELTHYWY